MNSRTAWRGDLGWSVCLGFGTVGYLWFWPRNLNFYDESILLYGARRILEGDVPYRDFFEIVTPGAWYLMAGVFHLFGASIETARATISVVHAISVVAIFLCGRTLGVTRVLAVIPPLAYLAVCYPNCDYVSPHWFATCAAALLLLALLIAPASGLLQARWLFVAGVFVGLTLAVQQQRGFALAVGVPLIVLVDHLLARRAAAPRSLLRWLAAYVAGGLLVGVPVLVYLLTVPGFEPSYQGLIAFPLWQYAAYHQRIPWGKSIHFAGIVLPGLFRYLPLLLPLGAAAIVADRHRSDWQAIRQRTTLLLFSGLSIATIFHNPDYLHIALIAPFFFILAADLVESVVRRLRPPLAPWVRYLLATSLIVALGYQAAVNVAVAHELFPVSQRTRFGEVNFYGPKIVGFIDQLQPVLDAAPEEEIFVYPEYPGFYLVTGAKNATRFSLLLYEYNSPAQFREVIDTLEAKRTRLIVFGISDERITAFTDYLKSAYRRVRLPLGVYLLFERQTD